MLALTRKHGQVTTLIQDGNVLGHVQVIEKGGKVVLCFDFPPTVTILREEAIRKEAPHGGRQTKP